MKPSIPKGTRDFGPAEIRRRRHILDLLKREFELFGFEPIETPAMENIETLTGKYGDEGDQLIFKILNSRINESRDKAALLQEFQLSLDSARNSKLLTEKALRYDLTVPFARFVVMNQSSLVMPFKRYQIQNVWRADKPQKGRYREFTQCDADIIGSTSLVNEIELLSLMSRTFGALQLPVKIKLNNRKVLAGIADKLQVPDKIIDITVAIDKLDKIGLEQVLEELRSKQIPESSLSVLSPLLTHRSDTTGTIKYLSEFLSGSDVGLAGVKELEYLFSNLPANSKGHTEIDLTLARGLNYYTGTIFEVKAAQGSLSSSILGGGRYDDLTGIFGLKNLSGVGISFGIDRIADVMDELSLFPSGLTDGSSVKVMFAHFDADSQMHALGVAQQLRDAGISSEVYPEVTRKVGKQFEYADKKKVPFVITIGSDEVASGIYPVKEMQTGVQQKLTVQQIIAHIHRS